MAYDKLGTYITKLMTTVIDTNEDDFVKELALTELRRLKVDISSFIIKHSADKEEETLKQEKQLLQEKKDGK